MLDRMPAKRFGACDPGVWGGVGWGYEHRSLRALRLRGPGQPFTQAGEPAELANLAAYLVSPYASWVSGTVVTFDGGESVALGGEFNALSAVSDAQWDMLEALGRRANSKGGAASGAAAPASE